MSYSNIFLFLVTVSIFFRYLVFPLLLAQLTRFRVSAISPLSIRGLEYRSEADDGNVVPTVRVERTGWMWGGLSGDEVGLLVIRLDGVSLRLKHGDKQGHKVDVANSGRSKRSKTISAWKARIVSFILHISIHHYPSLARIVSIQVSDVRVIFDDLDGLEITIKDIRAGAKISFDSTEPDQPSEAPTPSTPQSPREDYKRFNPLIAVMDGPSPSVSPLASPLHSPITQSASFVFPGTQSSPMPDVGPSGRSRMATARRRASHFQSRMTMTVAQAWSRAIARAHGSLSFTLAVKDIEVILPYMSAPRESSPMHTRSFSSSLQESIKLQHRSSHPGPAPRDPRKSFTSVGSLHSLFQSRNKISTVPRGGYDRLMTLGDSKLTLGLGFGPKKGLLAEDTLRTQIDLGKFVSNVESLEKLQKLAKSAKSLRKEERPAKKIGWSPRSLPRIVLRAFESVSLSFLHISITQHLPSATDAPVSARSSVTDMSALASEPDGFTLSLDLSRIHCRLVTADSSTDQRARNAFGTNTAPECKVKGIGFAAGWSSIGLQCLAPGEQSDEMSQLVQMRTAEIEGLSTWRPRGWTREELLFASDPNLSLVIVKGSLDSIDLAGDVQLLDELKHAWLRTHPPSSSPTVKKDPRSPFRLPPRVRFILDVGHAMVVLADRVSARKTTLSLASDGVHIGCFTSFSDVNARRRDKAASKAAFKREEELRQRRESAGDVDYSQPDAMLKPELRRHFDRTEAILQDDYVINMRAEATLVLEPMSLHMSLSDQAEQQSYHLASIGRAHGTLTGDILGRETVMPDGSDVAELDPDSMSCLLDLGIDSGVKVNLYSMPVIEALITMAKTHRSSPKVDSHPEKENFLCRLPSGVSARFSLGLISIFLGHEDPNPNCKQKLARGIWLQTTFLWEYAYYTRRCQVVRSRHSHVSPIRGKLRLPEDITTQALAFENALGPKNGRAALISFTLTETFIKPIFNGARFVQAGGTSLSHEPAKPPNEKKGDEYVGWEFRRPRPDFSLSQGQFANSVDPLEVSDTDQAARPLLKIRRAAFNWSVVRKSAESSEEHKLTSKVDGVDVVCDLSHIYCVLLATMTVLRIVKSMQQSPTSTAPKKQRNLSFEMMMPSLRAHFAFPLREHLFVYVDNVAIAKPAFSGVNVVSKKVLAFVPSPREVGTWDELARIKALEVQTSTPGQQKVFGINAEAMRIRIPVSYQLSKLILNVNVTIKAIKLLTQDLASGKMETAKYPEAEAPKRVPKMLFNIGNLTLEAKDDPIETNLNLIWRAGIAEQVKRNELEDQFETKIRLVAERQMALAQGIEDDDSDHNHNSKLTDKFSVSPEEARYRLDWYKSKTWVRRIRLAKQEQRRREQAAHRHIEDAGLSNIALPITVRQQTLSAPIFRVSLQGVKLGVEDLRWERDEIIDYMGRLSSPFDPGAEFSLMVPLKLSWSMTGGCMSLRDYPLPLIRLPCAAFSKGLAWDLETPFIIAEELQGSDSIILVPTQVVPAGCGHSDAAPLTVQIAKTIMPVKTYSRPVVYVSTDRTTEFTWGNAYQPAIQDMMKVIETLSHPPRDPSPRIGFWDKFRLILHWKVTINIRSTMHLHLKGSYDPYAVTGFGAGFALAWKGGTRIEINRPNEQHETIQISSPELLIAIPDLTALNDSAAMGNEKQAQPDKEDTSSNADMALIQRRYTKPCARFLNGVRVGFGFVLEKTCRPWNCEAKCGTTENNFHRQCRSFTFKKHQEVILRSPEAVEKEEAKIGRHSDSYEGFRSDYIHFSVSIVAPLDSSSEDDRDDAENTNSLHMNPKAFAHFFAWWRTFNHSRSLPIRQGKLFPNSPPPSKKFGRSIGTIKYRCDLAPVYVSHTYMQAFKEMWSAGKSQSLGIKARFDRFRADAHQRAQEMTVRNDELKRTQQVIHKPFYAADLLLGGIEVKGVRADFAERPRPQECIFPDHPHEKASELPQQRRDWYNFFDFIDADRKPSDTDPEIEIIDLMDCPHVFFSKRNKARPTTPHDDDHDSINSSTDAIFELESSKFGHEKSHICYLGAASRVAETQMKIVRQRIAKLEERKMIYRADRLFDHKANNSRLKTLHEHLEHLAKQEHRHIDDDTFQNNDHRHAADPSLNTSGDVSFVNTFHVHNPRVYYNNLSRNIIFKYFFSSRDRKREEYMTSHASLRGVRDGMQRRMARLKNGLNQDDLPANGSPTEGDASVALLEGLQKLLGDRTRGRLFSADDYARDDQKLATPSLGLPADCIVKAQHRFLILKPQIALRSEVAENSIILLAVEEVSFKAFSVLDQYAKDHVSADVLGRYFVGIKGLQAFYPTADALSREREVSPGQKGLDFIPLEIFLDVRSEATDYDRIVLKTDGAIAIDKFNHLRMPRGLEWPDAKDQWGQEIKHLRLHQDRTTIIVPRLQVSATSKHFNALYHVVTDLLMYQDPSHRQRAERIDNFSFAFDRKDRDPSRLLVELAGLQRSVRYLHSVQTGYEANADLLTDEGKNELFKLRTELLEATEQLFTVFEAISVSKARDEARAAMKSASMLNVRVGGLAWVMLRDEMAPLLKIDVESTLYSSISNKDGSTDNAMALGTLSALNSDSEALYPEVLVFNDPSANKRKGRDAFASVCWSVLAPVGGITIVRNFAVYLLPLRFRLEEKVGHQVTDYIFSERVERRKEKHAKRDKEKAAKNGSVKDLGMTHPEGSRSTTTLRNGDIPLSRSKSQASIMTSVSNRTDERNEPDEKFTMVPMKDATEMRKRASANRTFIKIVIGAASFVLSYKSDETRKHHSWKMPDCVDFKIKTPEMIYNNKVWGYEDIFEHVKRDIRNDIWSQTGHLLGQLFKKTSLFRTKNALRSLAMSSDSLPKSKSSQSPVSPSSLRHAVEPSTSMEDEAANAIALARTITSEREQPTSPLSRIKSRLTSDSTPQVLGIPLPTDQGNTASDHDDDEADEGEEGKGGGMSKTVKGIFGKIKKHTSKFDLQHALGSSDELARRGSVDRQGRRSLSAAPSSAYHSEGRLG